MKVWVGVCLFASSLCLASAAQGAIVTVSGQANIFGAGHAPPNDTPSPGGGGGGVPAIAFSFASGPNQVITFDSVTGSVSCCTGTSMFNGPDGGPHASGDTNILPHNGISGIVHGGKTMFLAGVFVGTSEPADPAPPSLDFTGADNFSELSPLLHQTFFIGDGLTGTGSGSQQKFHVPLGATSLYLGFADAYFFGNPTWAPGRYEDNQGELRVELSLTQSSAIPEPSQLAIWSMLVLGVLACRARPRRRFASGH